MEPTAVKTEVKTEPEDGDYLGLELEVKPDIKHLLENLDDKSSIKKKKYVCTECDKCFSSKINLKIHLSSKLHQSEKKFQCGQCHKRFSLQMYLNRHKIQNHANHSSSFQCSGCWRRFFRLSDLIMHKKRHISKGHKCTICNRTFLHKSMLDVHKCDVRFECYCTKTYTTRKGLRLHQQTHDSEKSHQCEVCFKLFAVRRYLRAHMAFHRGILEAFVCDVCFAKFPRKSSLRNHMKTHREIQCEICGLAFNKGLDLKRHKKSHRLLHPCKVCGRSFQSLAYLKKHKERHGNVRKPVQCDKCEKTFRFPSLLVRHVCQKHRKSFEHECKECGKSFMTEMDLNLHSKVHQIVHLKFDKYPGLIGYFNYTLS